VRGHRAAPPRRAFDTWCALTIDPASVLPTAGFHDYGVPAPLLPRLVQIEAHADDPLALPTLTRGGRVHTLSRVTAGRLDTATHYREVLAPAGLAHELLVAFTTTAGIWGMLAFFRGTDVTSRPIVAVSEALACSR
jgi:hypothetical protein